MAIGRYALYLASASAALIAGTAQAQDAPAASAGQAEERVVHGDGAESGEIVVTARKRDEKLIDVPVTVSVLSTADIARYDSNDLVRLAEMTPTVVVAPYKIANGGLISIRGISTPPGSAGLEQTVSVAIDGYQTSDGRIASLGFFDIEQVETLKGPQALFFGKNSPAGVIAIRTAGGTDTLQMGVKANYEFVADQITTEAYISGPLGPDIRGRIAGKFRKAQGWLYNDTVPMANPFYTVALPAGAAQLPGSRHKRLGDDEVMGRATLEYRPDPSLSVVAKLFMLEGNDPGSASSVQNIGPCPSGNSRVNTVVDVGECRRDNHMVYADFSPTVAAGMPRAPRDGRAFGHSSASIGNLNVSKDLGKVNLTLNSGISTFHYNSFAGLDSSSFNQLAVVEDSTNKAFSIEARALTDFDGPINFMVGAYLQNTEIHFYNDVKTSDTGYVAATGRYDAYEPLKQVSGRSRSIFAQAIWNIFPNLELAGGGRYSWEQKHLNARNLYGTGVFATTNMVIPTSTDPTPGVLAYTFKDDNFSPEATLTWHPTRDTTLYAAYKTGFLSGGFGLQGGIRTTTTIADVDFNSTTVEGFEVGAKGEFFDRKLRVSSAAFFYDFKDLQVSTFNSTLIQYTLNNAGAVKQRGAEIEVQFDAAPGFQLRGALTYSRNRFEGYVGQCYVYPIPAAQAQTAAAPSGCSFVLNSAGGRVLSGGAPVLQQVYDGRAPARSPDWAGNLGFTYDHSFSDDVRLGISGDALYSSSYLAADTLSPISRQDAYVKFNANLQLQWGDHWTFSLTGRNLTNKYILLYAKDRTGGAATSLQIGEHHGVVSRGREIAAGISFKF